MALTAASLGRAWDAEAAPTRVKWRTGSGIGGDLRHPGVSEPERVGDGSTRGGGLTPSGGRPFSSGSAAVEKSLARDEAPARRSGAAPRRLRPTGQLRDIRTRRRGPPA